MHKHLCFALHLLFNFDLLQGQSCCFTRSKKKKKNIALLRAYGAVQACSLQTAEYGIRNPCRPHEAAKCFFKEKQNIYQYLVFFWVFFFFSSIPLADLIALGQNFFLSLFLENKLKSE